MLKRDIAIILGCIASIGVPIGAHAEKPKHDQVYYMRKAFCEKEAAGQHFGVHWIKRQRYIRKCLADTRR